MSKRHYTSRRSAPGTAFALDVSPAQSIAQAVAAPAAVVPADEAAGVARSSGEAAVQLDAQKLTVYHVALEFHELACGVVPAVHRIVKDQLERASLSVVLNLAEGAGHHSRRQKARFYSISRGSAMECAAILDVLGRRRLAPVMLQREMTGGFRGAPEASGASRDAVWGIARSRQAVFESVSGERE